MLEANLVGKKKVLSKSLLIHFDGANNSNIFTNEYDPGFKISRVGNPVISTTQSKFGGSSGKFNREALALDAPIVLEGDYTAECWLYMTAYTPASTQMSLFGNANTLQSILSVYMSSDGVINYFNLQLPGWNTSIVGVNMLLNRWYHCATSRQGTTYRTFLDGVMKHNVAGPQGPLAIAHLFAGFGAVERRLMGYSDEVRIIPDVALYTGNFTPPTVPFTI